MKTTNALILVIFLSIPFAVSAKDLDLSDTAVVTEMTEMAEHGYLDAQIILADWYYNGREVKKNYSEAANYYELAAEQGHTRAQCILGGMYYLGKGVDKDLNKARHWLELAAEQDLKEAKVLLTSINKKQAKRLRSEAKKNKKPVTESLKSLAN